MYSYTPKGVCAKNINFNIVDDKITEIVFTGGCLEIYLEFQF